MNFPSNFAITKSQLKTLSGRNGIIRTTYWLKHTEYAISVLNE